MECEFEEGFFGRTVVVWIEVKVFPRKTICLQQFDESRRSVSTDKELVDFINGVHAK